MSSSNISLIHELIEHRCETVPHSIAIKDMQGEITYAELNQTANRFARLLKLHGVNPGTLVGVSLERNGYYICTLLAILKLGAAYLPIAVKQPTERLKQILIRSQITLLITSSALELSQGSEEIQILNVEVLKEKSQPLTTENLALTINSNSLAYVIYTSGSTGFPKGVSITHHNIIELFKSTQSHFNFNQHDIWISLHSFSFDFSVWEILGALFYGGKLILVDDLTSKCVDKIYDILLDEKVTVLNQTPSAFINFIHFACQLGKPKLVDLRYIIFGGEKLEYHSLLGWYHYYGLEKPQLINMYGITETTIHVTYCPIYSLGSKGSMIGKPLNHLHAYILDEQQNHCGSETVGELYISGTGLAQSYYKQPDLTAERFLPDPFSRMPGRRMYKTGDLALFTESGNIEYLGRSDDQVKLRGFRIELEEISIVLKQHPKVQDAVVLMKETAHNKQLIAYIIVRCSSSLFDSSKSSNSFCKNQIMMELKEHAAKHLLDYMVPASFVLVEKYPLTDNGKLDKQILLGMEEYRAYSSSSKTYTEPTSELEVTLVSIWSEIFNINKDNVLSITENFIDLGGNSLLAIHTVLKIRERCHIQLPIRLIFEQPTIQKLAKTIEAIKNTNEEIFPLIKPTTEMQIPLSHAQQRLWFEEHLFPNSTAYLIPFVFRLKGNLEIPILEKSISELIERQEVLSLSIYEVQSEMYQRIKMENPFKLVVYEPPELSEIKLKEMLDRLTAQVFQLKDHVLFRVKLISLKHEHLQEYILVMMFHHLIADEWSLEIIGRELSDLYNGYLSGNSNSSIGSLPSKKINYLDFAHWQRHWLTAETLEKQLNYWTKQLEKAPCSIAIPGYKNKDNPTSRSGDSVIFAFNQETLNTLKAIQKQEHVTVFTLILALFNIFLYRYSGNADLVLGIPVANRHYPGVENLVGFFANTLAIRTRIDRNMNFLEILQHVKKTVLDVHENQDLPFDLLVEHLNIERDIFTHPIFQMVVAPEVRSKSLNLEGLECHHIPVYNSDSKFDLVLWISDDEYGLSVRFEFNNACFDRASIIQMTRYFEQITINVLKNPVHPISSIAYINEHEKQLIQTYSGLETVTRKNADKCIHQIIEAQSIKDPQAIAISFENERLTYYEMNSQANRFAGYLQMLGIKEETIVAISMERSKELPIVLLAILKVGAVFAPIDKEYPEQRIKNILNDLQCEYVVVDTSENFISPGLDKVRCKISLHDIKEKSIEFSDTNLNSHCHLDNLSYIIYTSGTTGKPKGVMSTHKGLTNRLLWMQSSYGLTSKDKILQKTSYGFDVSMWEFFWPLIAGATLVMAKPNIHRNVEALLQCIENNKITVLHFVPSMLRAILEWSIQEGKLDAWESVKQIFSSGEALAVDLQNLCLSTLNARLFNLYGPTEASIDVTAWNCFQSNDKSVPIGFPIDNTSIYILDEDYNVVPPGLIGKLYIGGIGLARGYVEDPRQTAMRFIPDLFTNNGGRMYDTGDLAAWDESGHIQYHGRKDKQIKINGVRIERGDIESSLRAHPAVLDAAVILKNDTQDTKTLAAFISLNHSSSPLLINIIKQKKEAQRQARELMILANGLPITFLNKVETLYLYNEIFERDNYIKHGIEVSTNDTILDVGANIGMFSYYLGNFYENLKIYSIEPIPPIFQTLDFNKNLFKDSINTYNIALSDRCGEREFEYYSGVSIISGCYTNWNEDYETLAHYIKAHHKLHHEALDEILTEKLKRQTFICKTKTLSAFMKEEQIHQISLLKIDVEGSEYDILSGIEKKDWPKIKQIVVEVCDKNNNLEKIKKLLLDNEFYFEVEQEEDLKGTLFFNVYARKLYLAKASPDVSQRKAAALNTYNYRSEEVLINDLRSFLGLRLPNAMIPSSFNLLEGNIPTTASGKIDEKALLNREETIEVRKMPVEPLSTENNSLAETLKKIFSDVCRVEKVNLHDNFFGIGGDSILALKVVSKAKRENILFSVTDLFQYPTIQMLMKIVNCVPANESNNQIHALRTGSIPLTPIQKWFFSQSKYHYNHFANSIYIHSKSYTGLSGAEFKKALEEIFNKHDIFQILYHLNDHQWSQRYATELEAASLFYFKEVSLTKVSSYERDKIIRTLEEDLFWALDIHNGPLYGAVLIKHENNEWTMILLIHHLLIDAVSWSILLEEIECLFESTSKGKCLPLSKSNIGFKLAALSYEPPLIFQDFDTVEGHIQKLPKDFNHGPNQVSEAESQTVKLVKEYSQPLIKLQSKSTDVRIDDILIFSLLEAVNQWLGWNTLLLDVEMNGRECVKDYADISQTIGWFTNIIPMFIQLKEKKDELDAFKCVQDSLKEARINKHRHLNSIPRDFERKVNSEIIFNFMGKWFSNLNQQENSRTISPIKLWEHPNNERHYLLELNAVIVDDELEITCQYSRNHYRPSTIKEFINIYIDSIKMIVKRLSTPVQPCANSMEQKHETYSLTPMQLGLLYRHTMLKDPKTYFVQAMYEISKPVRSDLLKKSFLLSVKHNPVLRTDFLMQEQGNAVQYILPEIKLPWQEHDWSALSKSQQQSQLNKLLLEIREKENVLKKSPYFDLALIRLSEMEWVLVLGIQHILVDGYSIQLWLEEVTEIYEALILNKEPKIELRRSFRDYIDWINNQDNRLNLSFWKNYLETLNLETLNLETLTSTEPMFEMAVPKKLSSEILDLPAFKTFQLSNLETLALIKLSKDNHLPLSILIQGAWLLVIHYFTRSKEVICGITLSGRDIELPGIETMLGIFINTLPLRIQMEAHWTLKEFFNHVFKSFISVKKHQNVSLALIQSLTNLPPGMPLFESLIDFKTMKRETSKPNLFNEIGSVEDTEYPLSVRIETRDIIKIVLGYNRTRLSDENVEMMIQYFERLLKMLPEIFERTLNYLMQPALAQDHQYQDDKRMSTLKIRERHFSGSNLNHYFQVQVNKNPMAIALKSNDEWFTYKELDELSNLVALHFEQLGLQPQDKIALCLNRTAEFIILILAAIKMGIVYLPLEVESPKERLELILKDAKPNIVITSSGSLSLFENTNIKVFEDKNVIQESKWLQGDYPSKPVFADYLAYIIYTSGTTGQPKGVMVSHKNILNLIVDSPDLAILPETNVGWGVNLAFDVSTFEIWGALLNGACLITIDKNTLLSPCKLKSHLIATKIEILWLTTSLFNQHVTLLPDMFTSIKTLIIGGEAVSDSVIQGFYDTPNLEIFPKVINGYGPTETTTFSTLFEIKKNQVERIPIGFAIEGTTAYVLDSDLNPCRQGKIGEIYIGGLGVSRGYHNDPRLTAQNFLPNRLENDGSRLYKTGDLGKVNKLGAIEYCGRSDRQIKLRGHRIDLKEIEYAISEFPSIQTAIVLMDNTDLQNKKLIAYFVLVDNPPNEGKESIIEKLKHYLSHKLPGYMIPTNFMWLKEYPLTSNGKLDYSKLPKIINNETTQVTNADPFINIELLDLETKILTSWKDLLGNNSITRTDNFFQLGGHSIIAMQFIATLRLTSNIDLDMGTLFSNPTAMELAEAINRLNDHSDLEDIVPREVNKEVNREVYEA